MGLDADAATGTRAGTAAARVKSALTMALCGVGLAVATRTMVMNPDCVW